MSVKIAKEYFRRSDDPDASVDDVVALFADDGVLLSPREGVFRGTEEIREFFELNTEFFDWGKHHMERYHVDGSTVVCEGTIEGETSAGRHYEGVGLVDVMEFNGEEIAALRVYLDYSALLTEIPAAAPDFRITS